MISRFNPDSDLSSLWLCKFKRAVTHKRCDLYDSVLEYKRSVILLHLTTTSDDAKTRFNLVTAKIILFIYFYFLNLTQDKIVVERVGYRD